MVVTDLGVLKSGPLPSNTSAELVERLALIRELEHSKDKRVNIHTDSKYIFLLLHAHAAIWKKQGLFTIAGTRVKRAKEILRLLEAIFLLSQVAVIHVPRHQKGEDTIVKGNRALDVAARTATLQSSTIALPVPMGKLLLPPEPLQYLTEEAQQTATQGYHRGWWVSSKGILLLHQTSQ